MRRHCSSAMFSTWARGFCKGHKREALPHSSAGAKRVDMHESQGMGWPRKRRSSRRQHPQAVRAGAQSGLERAWPSGRALQHHAVHHAARAGHASPLTV